MILLFSQTRVKLVARKPSEERLPTHAQNAPGSRMTLPFGLSGSHLSDSTTLLNLHLRPARASSFRASNAKSQTEYGTGSVFGG